MAKSKERIIRDPSGPATVSRETIRQAAKQIWDDKRRSHDKAEGDSRYTRRDDDGTFTHKTDVGRSHAADQKTSNRTGRFSNAPSLKPNKK